MLLFIALILTIKLGIIVAWMGCALFCVSRACLGSRRGANSAGSLVLRLASRVLLIVSW